jgi:nucleoside-diphosphate-sugar epimerase
MGRSLVRQGESRNLAYPGGRVGLRALIIADDAPSRWRDVLRFVAEIAGGHEPKTGGRQGFPSFRVCNRRAREALGWAPFYADFRAGLTR